MLRTVLLGLFILLGVGMVAAMEFRTPPRPIALVQPPVAPAIDSSDSPTDISDSHDALAKADRLDIAVASNETPAQAALADESLAPPEGVNIRSSDQARVIQRHQPDSKPRKVAITPHPKSTPKAADVKRPAVSQRSKAATRDTEPCRLSAFGGLRKALNTDDCQI